jgi:hypothetical protein
MLSLPSKRWKKIELRAIEGKHYRMTFVSPIDGEEEFERIVNKDLLTCLPGPEAILKKNWKEKSIDVLVQDMDFFRQRLIFLNIIIVEYECNYYFR